MAIRVQGEHQFSLILRAISSDIVTAEIHRKLYRDLLKSIPEYEQELNQAPAFWSLTIRAHYDTTLYRLGRLYDQTKGALSLRTYLQTIERNMHLFEAARFRERLATNPFVDSLAESVRKPDPTILTNDMKSVSKAGSSLVSKLLTVRNQALAHRDTRRVLAQDADTKTSLTDDDIEELLTRALTIANRYSSLFRASTSSPIIVGHNDFLTVLEAVRCDIEQSEEQCRREEMECRTDEKA